MRLQVGKGLDQYLQQLGNLEMIAPQSMGKAIYEGANIVTDAIRRNIQAMNVDDTPYHEKVVGIKSIQKEGLLHSLGIAKATTDNGFRNVKIGFEGYNKLKSSEYPNGQPNAMIARTFEGGNSFTKKQPFVGPAIRATRRQAEVEMANIVDNDIVKIFAL